MRMYQDSKWDDHAISLARKWIEKDEVDFDADDCMIVAEALLRRIDTAHPVTPLEGK